MGNRRSRLRDDLAKASGLRVLARSSPRLLLWLLFYLVLAYGTLAAILAVTGQLDAFLQWAGCAGVLAGGLFSARLYRTRK
ncbi:hypothetical protein F9C11_07740 [Amycolatopsis sp. VS8301801F10]|uniref:hypothetical protein n=1 Tax=Amycolatopsis sp. VS8301801F10 TaxID=2652442 RepID=UPI0038FCE2B8